VLEAEPAELFGRVSTSPAAIHASMETIMQQLADTPELRRVLRLLAGAKRAELVLLSKVASATIRGRR
jgi:hypothetical protein